MHANHAYNVVHVLRRHSLYVPDLIALLVVRSLRFLVEATAQRHPDVVRLRLGMALSSKGQTHTSARHIHLAVCL